MTETEGRAMRNFLYPGVPSIIMHGISRRVDKQARAQGMGRHTSDETLSLGEGDLKAISNFLGECVRSFD